MRRTRPSLITSISAKMQAATTKIGFSTCGVLSPAPQEPEPVGTAIGAAQCRGVTPIRATVIREPALPAAADAGPRASRGSARAGRGGTRRAPRRARRVPSVSCASTCSRRPRSPDERGAHEELGVDRHRPPVADEDPRRHGREAVPGRRAGRTPRRAPPRRARRARAPARPGGARRSGTTPRTRAALRPAGCGSRIPPGASPQPQHAGSWCGGITSALPHVLERPEAELLLVEEAGVVDAAHVLVAVLGGEGVVVLGRLPAVDRRDTGRAVSTSRSSSVPM